MIGTILSGCFAGLGGAYLSIGYNTAFGSGMTTGRGFISLAALIFGNWTPIGCFLAGTFFGLLMGVRIMIEGLAEFQWLDPYSEFVAMIPYVFVIIGLAGIRRSIPPKAVGEAYEKEKRQ
jgi:simple sugar transport system permease protein